MKTPNSQLDNTLDTVVKYYLCDTYDHTHSYSIPL